MEQAKEKVYYFLLVFPLFVKIIFDPDWERRFKNNSKNILDICTGTEFFL
jgi:hypothetical protein